MISYLNMKVKVNTLFHFSFILHILILVLKEKNNYDRNQREKMMRESKSFNLITEKRLNQRNFEETLIGKLYVELESKKVKII